MTQTKTSPSDRQYDQAHYSEPLDIGAKFGAPASAEIDSLCKKLLNKLSPTAKALADAIPTLVDSLAVVSIVLTLEGDLGVVVHPVTKSIGDTLEVTGFAVHFSDKWIKKLSAAHPDIPTAIRAAEAKGIKFIKDTNPARCPDVEENAVIYPIAEFIKVAHVFMGNTSVLEADLKHSRHVNVIAVPTPDGGVGNLLMF